MHLTFSQTESHCRSLQFDDETDCGNCDGYEYDRSADDRGVVYSYNTAPSLMSGLHKSRAHELFYSGANRLLVFSMEFILFPPSGV